MDVTLLKLREYYAGQALASMEIPLLKLESVWSNAPTYIARKAYDIAEAMIKEKEKRDEQERTHSKNQ